MNKTFSTFLILAITLLVSPCHAFHTETDRQTDFSAYTLQRGQLRLGLFQQEVGLFDWWSVGTYTLPWLLNPIARSFNGSLYTKFKFIDTGKFAASFRPTAFYLSFHDLEVGELEDGDFDALVMPLVLTGSYIISDSWTVSAEATWVQSFATGDAEAVDDSSVLGAIAQSNLQFALYGEYRLSHVVAFNLIGRYVPFVTPANVDSTATIADGTSAQIQADAASEGLENAWLLQAGMALSWKTFNLQFGLGYGNIILPGARLVAAEKFLIPDFDFYWRF